jgi:hypothetical protein
MKTEAISASGVPYAEAEIFSRTISLMSSDGVLWVASDFTLRKKAVSPPL